MLKQLRLFGQRNYVKVSTSKQWGIFALQNNIEKTHQNEAEICRYLVFDVST